MASDSATSTAGNGAADVVLQSLVRGKRGEALRAQLAARYPDSPADSIEEAIQYACKSFLDEAEGITAPGQVYSWIRTAAHRSLGRETDRHHRELVVDPVEDGLDQIAVEDDSPAEELIALEDDADLELLVREVSSSLSDRRRDVLALHGAGYRRSQIAERLGLPERVVKRDIEAIMDEARVILARLAGGGCERGEPLVIRLLCGISDPEESAQAREHLSHCGRCELFSERLMAWRDKAGAMLPPVAEGASPGVVRRVAGSAGEKLSVLKQQVLDGGAQVKQHATATYYRAVDPTPLAAARPGTAAAVIASCIAIGGGAATYCVHEGVDPLGAAQGLIASSPDTESEQTSTAPEAESTGPTYTPAEPTTAEEPEPTPEPTPQPAPEPQPKPEPEPEPAPEDSFEPVTPAYQSSETESESSYEATEAAPAAEPAPAPASSGPQFGGP
ncbi:MAG TPA: sigma-70 family RNA polymerase sigma factor [Solirubrobacterales bacterium]|nr:sigma-70 family RNA polymerase sigma factor [Solirubrobacterales bacterium]